MKSKDEKKALIIRWARGLEWSAEQPCIENWEDAGATSLDDFPRHFSYLHTIVIADDGCMGLHMWTDVVEDLNCADNLEEWTASGESIVPVAIDISEPHAPDHQLIAGAYAFQIVYRGCIPR